MKTLAGISIMLLFVFGSGCARAAYDSLRLRQEMNCRNLEGADRDSCLRRSGMSYDEYQRKLKERDQSR